ncbi:hypothetical protein WJX73_001179 [Symbiochloris irregularis]|uniref:Uncharacterized protein n=1 Tax=Symbiochloris irregularis TaxID=706552 RepID=A0AAW1P9I4_9CHLO
MTDRACLTRTETLRLLLGSSLLTYRQASDDTRPAFLQDNTFYYVTQSFKDFGKDAGEPAIGKINSTDCQEYIFPIRDLLQAYTDQFGGSRAAYGHSSYELLSNFFYWVTPDLYKTPADDVLGYKHLAVCLQNFSLCKAQCLDITDVLIAYDKDMSWFCKLGA